MNHNGHDHFSLRIDGVIFTSEHSLTTGGKLLALAGKSPEQFLLALRIPDQPEQLIGQDEEFDLSGPGVEHFVTIDRNHHYAIRIDDSAFRVSSRYIDGRQILKLAGKTPEEHFVVQRISHADDVVIGLEQRVDLAQAGTERFDVVRKPVEQLYIVIDDIRYTPAKDALTGQELRNLPIPPIPASRDLWLDVPGKDDLKIALNQLVHLKPGLVFYTAPATINPGARFHAAN